MTTKTSTYVPIAAEALGMTVTEGAAPVVDALLNDLSIKGFDAAEVTSTGKVVALATIAGKDANGRDIDTIRPVGDTSGAVKLYTDLSAAITAAKRSNLPAGTGMQLVKYDKAASLGDPIVALKAKHKAAVTEQKTAAAKVSDLAAKQAAAQALGWDKALTDSDEGKEWADYTSRRAALDEWNSTATAAVQSLAASLTAAGIDPITYLPIASSTGTGSGVIGA